MIGEPSMASLVEQDPRASQAERMAAKAHDPVIVLNRIHDPLYAPYCCRCMGLSRMIEVEPFLWEHSCGAIHDERQVLKLEPEYQAQMKWARDLVSTVVIPPADDSQSDEVKCASCGERPVPAYRLALGSVLCIRCSEIDAEVSHER